MTGSPPRLSDDRSSYRYLAAGASTGYLAPKYAEQEATNASEGVEADWIRQHETAIAEAQSYYADGGIHVPDVAIADGTSASARSLRMQLHGVSSRDRRYA